jgi:HPt (histidine-containing phosphotransfer) domain-containing protein
MDDYLTKPFGLGALAAVLGCPVLDGSAPATAMRAAKPVLDAQVVARLERLGNATGDDLLGKLGALFLADADVRVVALRQALAGQDAAAVVRTAHSLCGAGANLGATDLARMSAALATNGAAGDLTNGGAMVEAVEAELGRVRSALDSRVPTP